MRNFNFAGREEILNTITLDMLYKYLERLSKEPPAHKYIKQIYNWFFQIEENNKESDYNSNNSSDNIDINQKVKSLFGAMAGNPKTNDVVEVFSINNLEDIGL